ncbi:MAG: HD domain-containing protein [Desulfobacteraceae bacterium]|nr:HD domain-containing protein [Desulfobacteraceae bacterium]
MMNSNAIFSGQERQIWAPALKYLERGRPGDVEHTRRVVAYGKALLDREPGNLRVVVPALIIHDTGWGKVDFSDFVDAPAVDKKDTASIRIHMHHGANIALKILEAVGWDPTITQQIADIIAVHDAPEKINALHNLDATLVFEADWLDKYGQASKKRYSEIFSDEGKIEELNRYLEKNKFVFFRSKAAKRLLSEITSKGKDYHHL